MTLITSIHFFRVRISLHGHIWLQSSLGTILFVFVPKKEGRRSLGDTQLSVKITNTKIGSCCISSLLSRGESGWKGEIN